MLGVCETNVFVFEFDISKVELVKRVFPQAQTISQHSTLRDMVQSQSRTVEQFLTERAGNLHDQSTNKVIFRDSNVCIMIIEEQSDRRARKPTGTKHTTRSNIIYNFIYTSNAVHEKQRFYQAEGLRGRR